MSSFDSQPPDSDDKSESTDETQGKQKWSMTPAAFDKLLNALASNRDDAGKEHERVRVKLCRYFEWRGVGPPEDLADETFNRAARRLDEGKEVDNVIAFIFGIARHVWQEALRVDPPLPLDETQEGQRTPAPDPVGPDPRENCFDGCMEKLLPENRKLILEYYQGERRVKIQLRQKIAERHGIPLNALRIRAHRIRIGLEKCIRECLEREHTRNV